MTLKGKRWGKTPSQPEAQPLVIRIIPTGLFIFYIEHFIYIKLL